MKREMKKDIAIHYAQAIWNEHKLNAIDELIDSKAVIHSVLGDFYGPQAMKEVVQAWLHSFPDLIVNNTNIIAEDDKVVLQWKAYGTHKGEFKGVAPTGKRVFYSGVTIYRIHDGKIVEYWAYLDMQHLLKQIS